MLLAQTTDCCDLMDTQEEASCVFGEFSHQKKPQIVPLLESRKAREVQ